MSKSYRVANHPEVTEFTYPADAISLRAIRDAGGLSKMSDEAREQLRFKTVKVGENCSDMPEPALSIYLERGWVETTDRRKPEVTEVDDEQIQRS